MSLSLPFMPGVVASQGGGGFDPLTITPDGWWDFSDISTMFSDDGTTQITANGLIYRINDKSGNAYHAKQAIDTKRPTYKTGQVNGLSVGMTDGGDALTAIVSATNVPSPYTYVYAFKFENQGTSYRAVMSGEGDSHSGLFAWVSSRQIYIFNSNDGVLFNVASDDWTTNAMVGGFKVNGASSQIYKNGVLRATGLMTGTHGKKISLFAANDAGAYPMTLDGKICEAFYFKRALSDTDRDLLEAYLGTKWGITVS